MSIYDSLSIQRQGKVDRTTAIATVTATGNLDDLDFGWADTIRMNNASLTTIRGLKAGVAGQLVRIVSIGAGQVDLAHQNAGSLTANRLQNVATSAVTSLAAGVGVATYAYDTISGYWRLVAHNQGAPITPAFNAANFTGNGTMTWTVGSTDVHSYSYYLVGRTVFIAFRIQATTIGGSLNNQLWAVTPGGYAVAVESYAPNLVYNGGVYSTSFSGVAAADTKIVSWRNLTLGNYVAETDIAEVTAQFSYLTT